LQNCRNPRGQRRISNAPHHVRRGKGGKGEKNKRPRSWQKCGGRAAIPALAARKEKRKREGLFSPSEQKGEEMTGHRHERRGAHLGLEKVGGGSYAVAEREKEGGIKPRSSSEERYHFFILASQRRGRKREKGTLLRIHTSERGTSLPSIEGGGGGGSSDPNHKTKGRKGKIWAFLVVLGVKIAIVV